MAVKAKPAGPRTCGTEGDGTVPHVELWLMNDKFLFRILWTHSIYITGESEK